MSFPLKTCPLIQAYHFRSLWTGISSLLVVFTHTILSSFFYTQISEVLSHKHKSSPSLSFPQCTASHSYDSIVHTPSYCHNMIYSSYRRLLGHRNSLNFQSSSVIQIFVLSNWLFPFHYYDSHVPTVIKFQNFSFFLSLLNILYTLNFCNEHLYRTSVTSEHFWSVSEISLNLSSSDSQFIISSCTLMFFALLNINACGCVCEL